MMESWLEMMVEERPGCTPQSLPARRRSAAQQGNPGKCVFVVLYSWIRTLWYEIILCYGHLVVVAALHGVEPAHAITSDPSVRVACAEDGDGDAVRIQRRRIFDNTICKTGHSCMTTVNL